MVTNAVTLTNAKNETSRSVHHALQLREQSARKTDEERKGIINTREDKRLNQALSNKRIKKPVYSWLLSCLRAWLNLLKLLGWVMCRLSR